MGDAYSGPPASKRKKVSHNVSPPELDSLFEERPSRKVIEFSSQPTNQRCMPPVKAQTLEELHSFVRSVSRWENEKLRHMIPIEKSVPSSSASAPLPGYPSYTTNSTAKVQDENVLEDLNLLFSPEVPTTKTLTLSKQRRISHNNTNDAAWLTSFNR